MTTDHRKRSAEGTVQRRLFMLLADKSADAGMLATLSGVGLESVRYALRCLCARGVVHKHRPTYRWALYAAVPGARPPDDRRGKPPGSRNHHGEVARANMLRRLPVMQEQARQAFTDPAVRARWVANRVRTMRQRRARRNVLYTPPAVVDAGAVSFVHYLGDDE